ncbi:hypothetical protein V6N13_093086 [Hibiscus sabdariffa]|uniref:Uncharacterized protein n=2 Tax=Hibiscus sabdariffa TaxID=183260 RepID=A0ABR1ZUY6_9ROSI
MESQEDSIDDNSLQNVDVLDSLQENGLEQGSLQDTVDVSLEWASLSNNSSLDLFGKSRGLKQFLRHWNKSTFGNIEERISVVTKDLDALDHVDYASSSQQGEK